MSIFDKIRVYQMRAFSYEKDAHLVECLICNRNELAGLAGRPRSTSDDPAGMEEDVVEAAVFGK
jgi:hypothetical protein